MAPGLGVSLVCCAIAAVCPPSNASEKTTKTILARFRRIIILAPYSIALSTANGPGGRITSGFLPRFFRRARIVDVDPQSLGQSREARKLVVRGLLEIADLAAHIREIEKALTEFRRRDRQAELGVSLHDLQRPDHHAQIGVFRVFRDL